MAPNLSGVAAVDAEASYALVRGAIELAAERLRPGGSFIAKTFLSPRTAGTPPRLPPAVQRAAVDLRQLLMERFARVVVEKPEASRRSSAEVYLVALGCRGPI